MCKQNFKLKTTISQIYTDPNLFTSILFICPEVLETIHIYRIYEYYCSNTPHQRCLHLAVVVGLAWLGDLESYVGGSLTIGRVTHAGKVKK
jgi:hypothetical protein